MDKLIKVVARAAETVIYRRVIQGDKITGYTLATSQEVARSVLSAIEAAGMVVVPSEPTEAMILAGHRQIDWCRNDQKTDTPDDPSQVFMTGGVRAGTYCGEDIVDAYRAMLAATQE